MRHINNVPQLRNSIGRTPQTGVWTARNLAESAWSKGTTLFPTVDGTFDLYAYWKVEGDTSPFDDKIDGLSALDLTAGGTQTVTSNGDSDYVTGAGYVQLSANTIETAWSHASTFYGGIHYFTAIKTPTAWTSNRIFMGTYGNSNDGWYIYTNTSGNLVVSFLKAGSAEFTATTGSALSLATNYIVGLTIDGRNGTGSVWVNGAVFQVSASDTFALTRTSTSAASGAFWCNRGPWGGTAITENSGRWYGGGIAAFAPTADQVAKIHNGFAATMTTETF